MAKEFEKLAADLCYRELSLPQLLVAVCAMTRYGFGSLFRFNSEPRLSRAEERAILASAKENAGDAPVVLVDLAALQEADKLTKLVENYQTVLTMFTEPGAEDKKAADRIRRQIQRDQKKIETVLAKGLVPYQIGRKDFAEVKQRILTDADLRSRFAERVQKSTTPGPCMMTFDDKKGTRLVLLDNPRDLLKAARYYTLIHASMTGIDGLDAALGDKAALYSRALILQHEFRHCGSEVYENEAAQASLLQRGLSEDHIILIDEIDADKGTVPGLLRSEGGRAYLKDWVDCRAVSTILHDAPDHATQFALGKMINERDPASPVYPRLSCEHIIPACFALRRAVLDKVDDLVSYEAGKSSETIPAGLKTALQRAARPSESAWKVCVDNGQAFFAAMEVCYERGLITDPDARAMAQFAIEAKARLVAKKQAYDAVQQAPTQPKATGIRRFLSFLPGKRG